MTIRMDSRFSGIKVLVWDFDGTLYKANEDLWWKVRESEYKTIMKYTGMDYDDAVKAFKEVYKILEQSATESVARICKISTKAAALDMESYYDRREYMQHDDQLVELFAKLTGRRHFMLANGVAQKLKETLTVLGVNSAIFEEIVTSETVGSNKPSPKGFRYVIEKSKLPPEAHLMIGDRELVDLQPAKTEGMKTCLVWSKTPSAIADVTLPTVYDVAGLFT